MPAALSASATAVLDLGRRSMQRSRLSPARARDYAGTRPFPKFGCWGKSVPVAYPGTTLRLVKWMSLNRTWGTRWDALWAECVKTNSDCFETMNVVTLSRPSWFLPQDDVVLKSSRTRR